MARKIDVVTLVLLLLSFVAWLVAMAGTAALTAEDGVKAHQTGYAWWTVWFQFGVLIFAGLAALMGNAGLNRLRTYLMLMVTVQWTIVANEARITLDTIAVGDIETDTQAALAGAILTLMFNFLFIIYWAMTEDGTALFAKKDAAVDAPPAKGAVPEPLPAV